MKKRFLALLCMVLALLSSFSLFACQKKSTKFTATSFEVFDTVTTIVGYAKDQAEFDEVSGRILAELKEYHKLFNIYEAYDGLANLCTVNSLQNGLHPTVTVDQRLVDLLLYAKEIYKDTNGSVNIAMGSVLSLWHQCREAAQEDPASASLPATEALQAAAKHTNIEDLVIDPAQNTVTITDPELRLDVGAIAKGYAVEMVARALEKEGIEGYLLNVGGNVRAIGGKANGEKWLVGIENPNESNEDPYFAQLHILGESLVTSGSYQRYYTVEGKKYHHIIDPETLMPAEGYLSVSVLCKSSAQGDALSTALFCMSPEEGLSLIEAMPGAEALWVMEDGTRQASSGFSHYTETQ